MDVCFQFIEPGELADPFEIATAVGAERYGIKDAVFDAVNLAASAAAFFRGNFPVEFPHFWWGVSMNLPWHKSYWKAHADGLSWSPIAIGEEAKSIAQTLADTAGGEQDAQPWSQITYLSQVLSASDKTMMQGLAVEAMLSVDGFLSLASKGRVPESITWLTAAYKNIIECTCQAQQILGYATENARNAARARHRENHAMKEQLFAWCAAHLQEYPSMDAAAEAVAGKLVPVTFRTVRSWIGEYRQKEQSARTP